MIIVINILYRLIIQYIHSIYPILYTRHEYIHTSKVIFTIHRLSGFFAPIFYFNFEHFLFVYIVKQKQSKVCGFYKECSWTFKFSEIEFCWRLIFETLIIHKPSLVRPTGVHLNIRAGPIFAVLYFGMYRQFTITKAAEECAGVNVRSRTKFWPDRFSRFDVYWIQTDRQTDKQSIQIDVHEGLYLNVQSSTAVFPLIW